MAVQRWVFTDQYAGESWTVPQNPAQMSGLFAEKAVSIRTTTAVDGQAILFEGNAPVHPWDFSGSIRTPEHYAELLRWVEKKNRIIIADHFGRTIPTYLLGFEPTPKRSLNVYWRHDYTVKALVLGTVGAPTVGV